MSYNTSGGRSITAKRITKSEGPDEREDDEEEYSRELGLDDEEIQELKDVFAIFDKDGDGEITTKELGTVMNALGHTPTEAELFDIIEEVDKDGNGLIDFFEFASMMKNRIKTVLTAEDLKEAFIILDRDGNGFITANEIKQIIENLGQKISDSEIDDMIREVDLDGDGMICFEDFCAFMKGA